MPNPKSGSVTNDISKIVKEIRSGKIEFRLDKAGIVHAPMGKVSFKAEDILANLVAFIETLVKLKPSAAKGKYLKSIAMATTMGPSIFLDNTQISNRFKVT
jgi:large subunit ribosomal protein L1